MANLAEWIKEAAGGESIEAVVIGEMGWRDYNSKDVPGYDKQPRGKVLTWDEARPWLDYEFYEGYGAPGCNAVYAWTANWVLFISQYDGSTECDAVPRNPIACLPQMPGR
jgi:hypothetical protein